MDTEAEAIADLAQRADTITVVPHELGPSVLVTDGELAVTDLEGLLPIPRRPTGTVKVLGEASFVHAVNRWGDDATTTVYVDTARKQMTAVLNDVKPDSIPGWRDWRVVYTVPISEAFAPWVDADGALVGQVDFAQFIEENMGAVAEPAGRDLYAIVTTLEGSVEATWKHRHRDADGSRTFHYAEESTAAAGEAGDLTVPPTFTLVVPVFEGGEPREIVAKLRYRVNGGKLLLGFVLTGLGEIVRDEFQAAVERVQDGLDEDAAGEVLLAEAPAVQSPRVAPVP